VIYIECTICKGQGEIIVRREDGTYDTCECALCTGTGRIENTEENWEHA